MEVRKEDHHATNHIPDWAALWTELAQIGNLRRERKLAEGQEDRWHKITAEEFNLRVYERWEQRDSSRQFVLQTLAEHPDSTVLDIGAGTGTWTIMMAPHAKSVTALDASPAMLEFCRKELLAVGLQNVSTVLGSWPEIAAGVQAHDICLCSHAMYGSSDFAAFVRALEKSARKRVILLIRAPSQEGVMAQAARLVWGHPYDSPNYQIAIQILWEMGIFPHVIMENRHLWKQWRSASLEDALEDVKSRLGLFEDGRYDEKLAELLRTNLRREAEMWVWPAGIRTALLWWDVS